MLLFEKQVVIAGMNSSLYGFYLKGKKNFNIIMPAPIMDIVKLEVKRTQSSQQGQCVIVALANGEIRLYSPKEKNLINVLKIEVSTFLLSGTGAYQRSKIWNIWKRGR
jgi:hypothetical protein